MDKINEHASNPVNPWINGNETAEFNYKYGDTPYHVYMRTQGCIVLSLMVFADSTTHVVDILRAMIKHLKKCNAVYNKEATSQYKTTFYEQHGNKIKQLEQGIESYLEGNTEPNAVTCDIQELYKGQAYKIGWASNDTI